MKSTLFSRISLEEVDIDIFLGDREIIYDVNMLRRQRLVNLTSFGQLSGWIKKIEEPHRKPILRQQPIR